MVGTVTGLGPIPIQIEIPGKGNWTILYKRLGKQAPIRKRPRRIQAKIFKREGRLHYSKEPGIEFKLINKTEKDLDPKILEEWTWLGEIYRRR